MKAIKINDFYMNQVKAALAYPVAPRIHLTDDEIKAYSIWEAMYQYYLKFPILVYEQKRQVITPMEIFFPNDDVIGVADVRTVDKGGISGEKVELNLYKYNSTFLRNRYSRNKTRRPGGSGTFNPNGLRHLEFQERMLHEAQNNNLNTFKQIIDPYEKKITVFSTINAKIDITWAMTSNDFDKIKPTQIINVINLAKANLRLHLASLGGMMVDQGAEKQINVDYLTNEAKEVKEKIIEQWMMSPDAISIRMT